MISRLSVRFGFAFLAYVFVGSALLLAWLKHREQQHSSEVFATLVKADADFIRELRLPRSARLAEDLSRLLKLQVHFRDQARSLVPMPSNDHALALAALPPLPRASRLGTQHEAIAVPIDALSDVLFVREIPSSISSLRQPENLAALAAFAGLSLALALGLSRTVVRPIQALTQRLPGYFDEAETTSDSLPTPLPETERKDEIGQLATALSNAREQLAKERERRAHSERLAMLGRMATGLAHEIKNPVAGITLHAQLLTSDANDEATAAGLQQILDSASEVDGLVNQWLFLARPAPPAMSLLDLAECVNQTLRSLLAQASHAQVKCLNELPEGSPLWVNGDRLRLVQALRNLMLNAIQAMSRSGGELRISSAPDETHRINLCITDNGPGFTEAALAHAQDLFFSEREGGMGVGLSVVTEVIAAHGGTLQLANHQPHGASVTISLPRPPEYPVSPN